MTNRTLSLAVVVLLVLGVLTSAAVVTQNQQLLMLAESVERLSDQAERTFEVVRKRAMDEDGSTATRQEPISHDEVLIPSGVDYYFFVKRTYEDPLGGICHDYKLVATAGGPVQDVILQSFVGALGSEVFTEGGGCVDYALRLGSAGGDQEVLWIQIVEAGFPSSSPVLRLTLGGDTDVPHVPSAHYRTVLQGGVPDSTGRYWVGALDENTLAVLDLRKDMVVATHDIAQGRTLVKEAELFQYYGTIELVGTRTVRYETFTPPVAGGIESTDRRVETWVLPSLP